MTVSTLLQHETLLKPDHYGTYAPAAFAVSGLPSGRFVGVVAGIAPTGGPYLTGDYAIDDTTPSVWVCTVAGTPGTWLEISGGGGAAGVASFNTRTGAVTLAKADVTGTGLAAADISAEATANKGVVNGYASLDAGGKVPTAQLPALAITDTFVVASQAAMLALTAQRGDVAIRTDSTPNVAYILTVDDPTTLANWQPLDPATTVTSVNGGTGAVTITAAGLGALVAANNLSDIVNAATARTNLGLGSAATQNKVAAGSAGVLDATDASTTNARTPTAHHTSHESGGTDPFTGIVPGSSFAPSGLTGAVAATRFVGGTASGAPTTGTFAVGDFVITQAGGIHICTVAGTPGTWTRANSADYAPIKALHAVVDHGNSGTGTVTLDVTAADTHKVTATGNFTLAFSNLWAGAEFVIELVQDATGGRTVTWPGAVTWPDGAQPILSTAAGSVDTITGYSPDGTTIRLFSNIRTAVLGQINQFSNVGNNTWPTANRAYLWRFTIGYRTKLRYVRYKIGVQAGNIQFGVVSLSGSQHLSYARIMDSGVIACPAAGSYRADLGSTLIDPGEYAMYFWASSATMQMNLSSALAFPEAGAIGMLDNAAGVPSSGTLASWLGDHWIGMTLEGDY